MAGGPDLTTALMAAISKAIIEASPPNPREPEGHLVDLVVARGALMGVLSLVTECDPNLRDADIAMVGRNIGEAMTKQIAPPESYTSRPALGRVDEFDQA